MSEEYTRNRNRMATQFNLEHKGETVEVREPLQESRSL